MDNKSNWYGTNDDGTPKTERQYLIERQERNNKSIDAMVKAQTPSELSNNLRLIAHVMLGSLVGFFSACIFLILYYFTTYTMPISESVRFKNAFWNTFYIDVLIFGILYFRDIKAAIESAMPEDEDEGEDESE